MMVRFPDMLGFISSVESCKIESKGVNGMSLQQNMAAFLCAAMQQQGKSLSEFSAELGISRNALYDYSCGEGNPTILTVEHIADKMGVSPAALILDKVPQDGRGVTLPLLETLQCVGELSAEGRQRFTELFLEMVELWNKR